jgi:predicted ATPase/DNA-binding SARP family transcriptional activator
MGEPAVLQVHLLGGFRVEVSGRAVPAAAWRQRKAAAIVKLLALEPGNRVHREQLVDALWPDLDPEAAANNLRVALYFARKQLNDAGAPTGAFLMREGTSILLGQMGTVWTDVEAFDLAAARAWRTSDPAAAVEAAASYSGDLLPEDVYEEWTESRRAALRASCLTLLARAAQAYEKRGNLDRAIALQQRVIGYEPAHEEAHVALMRLFAQAGQRGQAIAQFERLVTVLEREVGEAPEPASRTLLEAIRDGRFPDHADTDAAAADRSEDRGLVSHLPAPVDALIGREREVAEIRRLLATARLLTLTGPGGVGKTRLSVSVAHDLVAAFPDGAHFVDLAPIRDPDLVAAAVAQVIGVRETAGLTLVDAIKVALHDKRVLLVLDNVEQVIEAASVVADVLAACPRLVVLVTSRIRLRLRGEQEYPVSPLALPNNAHDRALETVTAFSAVALFATRAREARPDFAVTHGNLAAVAAVCWRLDGLPLAIELAAARVRVLSPEALLERLEHPLTLLTGGARDLPERQRTIRDTIDWSHELLSSDERALFRRLAVFVGGWSFEAAETVGVQGDDVDVLTVLGSLVDHSLVRREEVEGQPRFSMLVAVREFAREKLAEAGGGEAELTRRLHAEYVLAVAERAEPELTGPEQVTWLERLEAEHDNLRAALAWCREAGEPGAGVRLAGAVWRFWDVRGYLSEGRHWLEWSLSRKDGVDPSLRAKVLKGAAALAHHQGEYDRARELHERELVEYRAAGDERGVAQALGNLASVAVNQGDYKRADALFAECLVIFRGLGDRHAEGLAVNWLGAVASLRGEFDHAAELYEESLELSRTTGNKQGIAFALVNLAETRENQGDVKRAVALYDQSLHLFRELGDARHTAFALQGLGQASLTRGDLDGAQRFLAESLALTHGVGDKAAVAGSLERLAVVALAKGDVARAARVFSAADALRTAIGAPRSETFESDYSRSLDAVRTDLGPVPFATAWEAGKLLSLDAAVADASG